MSSKSEPLTRAKTPDLAKSAADARLSELKKAALAWDNADMSGISH